MGIISFPSRLNKPKLHYKHFIDTFLAGVAIPATIYFIKYQRICQVKRLMAQFMRAEIIV